MKTDLKSQQKNTVCKQFIASQTVFLVIDARSAKQFVRHLHIYIRFSFPATR